MTRPYHFAVDGLYKATLFVQSGDFFPPLKVRKRDQLGVLGESFNLMTDSINKFIEDQKQHQRLRTSFRIALLMESGISS